MPERTPSQTVGPYLHIGLAPGAYGVREIFSATRGRCRHARHPHPHRGPHPRRRGQHRARRAWSRSGRPTPRAATPIPRTGGRSASNSFRGFGRCADRQGRRLCFDTVKPGAVPGPGGTHAGAAHQRRGASRAACSSGCSRASTSPAIRPTPPIRSWPWCRPSRRDTLHRQARPRQARPLPLRHPPAGRQRDRVLRRVTAAADHRQTAALATGASSVQHGEDENPVSRPACRARCSWPRRWRPRSPETRR